DAEALRAQHEHHDGADCQPLGDAAGRAMLAAAPAAPAVAPAQDAFDVALTALDRYQHNWDTGLPGEYAQPERIHMECAVEAVREALTEARDAAPAQAEQQGMCEHYDFRSSCQECRKAEQQGESYKCSRCGSSTTLGCTGMGCGYLESGVGEPEQQGDDCCHGCAPASECKVECGGLKEQQGDGGAPGQPKQFTDEQIAALRIAADVLIERYAAPIREVLCNAEVIEQPSARVELSDEQRAVLGGNFGALETGESLCRRTGNDSCAEGLAALSHTLRAILAASASQGGGNG
ncbi:MAG: hypothetical protein ACTHJ9_11860, partial [Rhodanobacter sp.]